MTERTTKTSTLDASGKIQACSASQVKTHRLCKKKWYYEKVQKIPKGPPSAGAKESAESHERMEIYLKTGGDGRNGYERHGDEMLKAFEWAYPWKGGPMLVEESLTAPAMRTPGGVLVTGFFDAYIPAVSNPEAFNEMPVIIDHKFLKSLDWAASYDELAHDDPQATMYMAWALERQPWVDGVRFRHHNHQKKGPRLNRPIEIRQTRAHIFERMAALGKYIDTEMQATAAAKTPGDVEGAGRTDGQVCKAFGGCDYRSFCPDAPQNRFIAAMQSGELPDLAEMPSRGSSKQPATNTTQPNKGFNFMGLLDDIAKEVAPARPSGEPAAAKPALKALLAENALKDGIYMLPGGAIGKCKGRLEDKIVFLTHDKTMTEVGLEDVVRDLAGDAVAASHFQPKVAAPEKPRKLDLKVEAAPSEAKAEVVPPTKAMVDDTPKIDVSAGVIPPDAPQDTNPKQVASQTAVVEVAATVSEALKTDIVESKPKRAKKTETVLYDPAATATPKTPMEGIVLIINAASTHGQPLAPYIAKLAADLCKQHGLVDLRLAPKQSDAAFMGWRGLLAIEAKKNPPPPGFYTVTSGDLADPVIEALEPTAMAVIKGGAR